MDPWDGSYYGGFSVPPTSWLSLEYPVGHNYEGMPINLAFAVTTAHPTGADEPEAAAGFRLHQNVPNPFNPVTEVHYDVPFEGGRVLLQVFDVSGRLVRTLVDAARTEGTYSATWRGDDEAGRPVSSGIYFCRLSADGATQATKMLLLK